MNRVVALHVQILNSVQKLVGRGLVGPFQRDDLGIFGGWHVYMVLRNRTTVEPDEKKYDVGLVANVRQVMGRDAALWLLPLEGAGPTVDGIHWPLNPRRFDLAAAAAEREVEVLANNSTTSSLAEAGVAEEVMAANKDRDA